MRAEIERFYGVRVLADRVMGSHRWGYARPDSDIDYHFVYVRPLECYCGFLPRKPLRHRGEVWVPDTGCGPVLGIPRMRRISTDCVGYDLTDFVHLITKCDMGAVQFLSTPESDTDHRVLSYVRNIHRTMFEPNLLIRKYLGHARASLKEYCENGDSKTRWALVRDLAFAYQLRETRKLEILDVVESAQKFLGINSVSMASLDILKSLQDDTDDWVLNYPARDEQDVLDANRLTGYLVLSSAPSPNKNPPRTFKE